MTLLLLSDALQSNYYVFLLGCVTSSQWDNLQSYDAKTFGTKINVRRRIAKPVPVWAALEFFHDSQADTANDIQAYLEPLVRKALADKARRASGNARSSKEVLSFLDHLALSIDGERGSLNISRGHLSDL